MRTINQLFLHTIICIILCSPVFNFAMQSGDKELLNSNLLQALLNNQWEIARALLEQKADPNFVVHKNNGTTILMEMAQGGTPEAVACLISAKADPATRSHNKVFMNALNWCTLNNNHSAAIAKLLIERMGTYQLHFPDQHECRSYPLLQAATIGNRAQLIALLLDYGANPHLHDGNGLNVLDIVCAQSKSVCPDYKECPFKTALLLYRYGAKTANTKLKNYFSTEQIKYMKRERAQFNADRVYIFNMVPYTFPFKISYNNALTHILLRALSGTPASLIGLIASYAAYHPELEDYSRDPEGSSSLLQNYWFANGCEIKPIPSKKKKSLKEKCIIQ